MKSRVCALVVVTMVSGCSSEAPAPTPRREPASPVGPAEQAGLRATPDEEATPAPPMETLARGDDAVWRDATQGVQLTLVYVTEMGARGAAQRPGAIVLSSDPSNPHFTRKSSASVKLHRLTRAEMARLVDELGALGFDALPWAEQPYDAQIGAERALYRYRAGKRTHVRKDQLDEAGKRVFTAVERELIETMAR